MPTGNGDVVLRALGTVLRARRLQLELTQEELAGRAKLHRTYIGSVERGERNITFKNLVAFATALETNIEALSRSLRIALSEIQE